MYYKRNIGGLWLRLGLTIFREGLRPPISFKEKIIHRHTVILLWVDFMYWYLYDIANLLNYFRHPRRSPSRFFVTFSFTKHVILLTLSFPLFQVKRCLFFRAVVINSLQIFPWLGGSLHSIPLDCFVVIMIFLLSFIFYPLLFVFILIIGLCITIFMLGITVESGFFIFKLDDLFWWFITLGYPVSGFVDLNWNCVLYSFSLTRGLGPKYRRNFIKVLVDFRKIRNFLKIISYRLG